MQQGYPMHASRYPRIWGIHALGRGYGPKRPPLVLGGPPVRVGCPLYGPKGAYTRLPRGGRIGADYPGRPTSTITPPQHLRAGFQTDNLPGPCILPRRARMVQDERGRRS
jgi:hypothetical protein